MQILVGTNRYDVAMPISSPMTTGNPVGILEKDVTVSSLPDGWNTASFTYVGTLMVTSTDFTGLTRAAMLARLEADLASAARVSVYGQAYSSGSGVHNVHFNGGGRDGVVLVHGAGAAGADRAIALHYASQTF